MVESVGAERPIDRSSSNRSLACREPPSPMVKCRSNSRLRRSTPTQSWMATRSRAARNCRAATTAPPARSSGNARPASSNGTTIPRRRSRFSKARSCSTTASARRGASAPGDVVFFPGGSVVSWTVQRQVRKLAFFRRPLPAPLALVSPCPHRGEARPRPTRVGPPLAVGRRRRGEPAGGPAVAGSKSRIGLYRAAAFRVGRTGPSARPRRLGRRRASARRGDHLRIASTLPRHRPRQVGRRHPSACLNLPSSASTRAKFCRTRMSAWGWRPRAA